MPGQQSYLALVRKYLARLDTVVTSCEAGYQESAYGQINPLLSTSQTGASPAHNSARWPRPSSARV